MENSEIISLVKRAMGHGTDRERACNELYRLYEKPVRAYIASSLLHKPWHSAEVEELTIEVMARGLTRLSQYRSTFYFFVWLRGIATNLWKDILRGKKRNKYFFSDIDNCKSAQLISSTNRADDRLVLSDHIRALKHILSRENPSHRRICELRYLEEKSYREIAEVVNVSIKNVSSVLCRARQKLMRAMPR